MGLRTQALEMNKRKVRGPFLSSWALRWSCCLEGGTEGSELSQVLQNWYSLVLDGCIRRLRSPGENSDVSTRD